jgi:hypothetical protein
MTFSPASREGRNWRNDAACRDVDPELFQPTAESGPVLAAQVAEARAVCERCPVRAECLSFALAMLPHGIAGGLTETERSALRRRAGAGRTEVAPAPVAARPSEVAAAGRAAIRAGRPPREVGREFGVSERTADRWAAQVRAELRAGVA